MENNNTNRAALEEEAIAAIEKLTDEQLEEILRVVFS